MIRSIYNGLVGACALTLAHQVLKHTIPDAPRMDFLGMQSIQKMLRVVGVSVTKDKLFLPTLIGDIVSNTLYFSQVGEKSGVSTVMRGLTLGIAAGSGALILPEKIGLDGNASHKTMRTAVLTVSLYTLGGLVSGLAAQCKKSV